MTTWLLSVIFKLKCRSLSFRNLFSRKHSTAIIQYILNRGAESLLQIPIESHKLHSKAPEISSVSIGPLYRIPHAPYRWMTCWLQQPAYRRAKLPSSFTPLSINLLWTSIFSMAFFVLNTQNTTSLGIFHIFFFPYICIGGIWIIWREGEFVLQSSNHCQRLPLHGSSYALRFSLSIFLLLSFTPIFFIIIILFSLSLSACHRGGVARETVSTRSYWLTQKGGNMAVRRKLITLFRPCRRRYKLPAAVISYWREPWN